MKCRGIFKRSKKNYYLLVYDLNSNFPLVNNENVYTEYKKIGCESQSRNNFLFNHIKIVTSSLSGLSYNVIYEDCLISFQVDNEDGNTGGSFGHFLTELMSVLLWKGKC